MAVALVNPTPAVVLVETSEDDSFVAVAQFVGSLLNEGEQKTALVDTPGSRFSAECEKLMAEQKLPDVVARFVGQVETIYSKCSTDDARCCIGVISHLVPKLDESKVLASATALAKAIAAKQDDKAEERLAALVNLYNVCPYTQAQHAVLSAAIEYAKGSRQLAAALLPSIRSRVDEWVKQWKLTDAQARDLYLSMASLYSSTGIRQHAKDAAALVTKALSLVAETDAAGLAAVKPQAVAAVTTFIQLPDAFTCDFAELPAVKALAKDAQHGALFKLLAALLAGDMQAYKAAATPAVLSAVGVTPEAGLAKARMMALLALAGRAGSEPVAFSAVQAALDVAPEAVEPALIRAIGARLLEAKIDQIKGVVSISQALQTSFGGGDWGKVRAQLAAYRDNLAQVAALVAARQQQ